MDHVRKVINELHEINENRDAFASINGYFYQFELTLLHILNDGCTEDSFEDIDCDATYEIEKIEDYVKHYQKNGKGFIRVAQIKHHMREARPSTYYDATLYLYFNYLNFLKKGILDTEYLARIFHYDESPKKDIAQVLKAAFKSNESKKAKQKKEDEEKQSKGETFKERPEDIVDKINKTGLNNEKNQTAFYEVAQFVQTESHHDVTESLQKKLTERYSDLKESYTPEHLYASAVSKLINDGKKGIELTLEKLDKFFDGKINTIENFYELKIWNYIGRLIDANIYGIEVDRFVTERLIKEEYRYIYLSLIAPFLKEKFKVPQYRKSFLLSVTPKAIKVSGELGTHVEFRSFVESSDSIKQFLSTLAKMIYYHRKVGENVDLEGWFDVTHKGWLFNSPQEQRGTGVIIGDFPRSLYESLSYLLPRLKDEELRPEVWYTKHTDSRNTSSDIMSYEHDITVPSEEDDDGHIICSPSEAHFYIQCLQCLDLHDYSSYKSAHNIFQNCCSVRGGR
ncbi:hypothetical protein ABEP16_21520 [Priestia aryabhattai]|uniref:hypothetical protein n=1 Tax=Priestia aryabhattai TaxID=412384 RepID=UPI003D2A813D